MSNQPRVVKVLAALLISMTTGAVVLMALGDNPPSAGPFCLSAYYRLDSVDHALRSRIAPQAHQWQSIEIAFSGTKGGNIQRLAVARGLSDPANLDCHFLIGNGIGANDGEIQTTESWLNQRSVPPGADWRGDERTIRVCLVGNGVSSLATDYQLKRLEMLLESLCRRFDIHPDAVYLPRDCQ
ncbi:MAG: N-acetylmuramoyl-L-alanine amidase [Sedimentisphaerales bacterium]|jgi:hypothetical protein|nr:N-acetylmuramoyl-L-alanine amidase [Sedimentisphaerales bacterium]NLT76747.1 N-acetylmuramoyl-L-alanine amidase [Planctomycetota bacterium]